LVVNKSIVNSFSQNCFQRFCYSTQDQRTSKTLQIESPEEKYFLSFRNYIINFSNINTHIYPI